jgi:MFS family permease
LKTGEPMLLARLRSSTRALRHRNFRLFIIGQGLTLVGTWVQSLAQSWLVYRLSHSPVMLGVVSFASLAPYLFLAPVAGVVCDRVNRRKLILVMRILAMLQAALLAVLTLTGAVQVWHVFYLALALGVIGVFEMTARQSFLVEMVGKEDLMNGIALNSSVYNSGRIVGPAIAGLMVAAVGEGWCFAVNSVSFLAVIVSLLLMRLPAAARPIENVSPLEHFREGWNFVRSHAPSRALLLLLGLTSVMNYPYLVLMPVFADTILAGGPQALGWLMSANGSGAILGSIYMASRTGLTGLSRTITHMTILYGAALVLFALSPNLYLSMFLLLPVGFGMMVAVAATNTALQTLSPDPLRGRVLGFYGMMFVGMTPIGALLAGWAGDQIGAPLTVIAGATFCIAGALLFNRKRPVIRAALRQFMEQQADTFPVPVPVTRPNPDSR